MYVSIFVLHESHFRQIFQLLGFMARVQKIESLTRIEQWHGGTAEEGTPRMVGLLEPCRQERDILADEMDSGRIAVSIDSSWRCRGKERNTTTFA